MNNIHEKLEQYTNERAEVYLSEQFKALIDEAEKEIEQIEPEDLYVLDNDIVLIDVREPEEFASGYINAHNSLTIPRGKLEFVAIKKIAQQFGEDAKIVTYCLKGPRGSLAAYQLKKMGFSNVRNLSGGLLNWLSKGNTIHSYLGELSLAK
jgi:rhodanese-related sulfurtransferase